MAIAEPIELFGVNRKDMKATFHKQLDDGTPWYFDGDRHTVHLPCGQSRQPCGTLRQSDSLRLDAACTDTVAVLVQDTDLVRLRAPINPHKPLVGEGRLRGLITLLYLVGRTHCYLASLFVFPVVCIRPYTGARGATSYKICTTDTLLGDTSSSGTARDPKS